MTLEEYKLGEMHFPKINGTDEGNFFIFLLGVTLSIIGQDCMLYVINDKYNITVGKLMGLGVVAGGVSCVFNIFFHTYQKKGCKESAKICLDILPFYGVIIIPLVYLYVQLDFYKDNKWLIFSNICLLFARITMDIQVKILTLERLSCNIMYNFTNISLIFSLFLDVYIVMLYSLYVLLLLQAIELAIFIVRRAKQITDYLEIRIFCINPVMKV